MVMAADQTRIADDTAAVVQDRMAAFHKHLFRYPKLLASMIGPYIDFFDE